MAYLTATILKQESAWYFTQWQPQITNTTDFDTWIGTVVTRASLWVKWRVGATTYGSSDATVQAILLEAELCRAQCHLLLASAALADTSDDAHLVPELQSGPKLLRDARYYERLADQLTAPYCQGVAAHWAMPGSSLGAGVPASVPDFEQTVAYEKAGTP